MLAALASAAMPGLTVATVRGGCRANATDESHGIDHTVVQDAAGRAYDVFVSGSEKGRRRLADRVQASRTLGESRELNGLGFGLDTVLAFADGSRGKGPTGNVSVLVTAHAEGEARNLDLLTLDDCAAIGTAIGAIHRLNPSMLRFSSYPTFVTGQIHAQLSAWIRRLRAAGHIPPEITDSWDRIIETEGLWSFTTRFVHGGFVDGDVLFSGTTITAITNWQNMQVNDPARDLAWIFAKLDEEHRNAVLSAYGRIMGSRLDDLIMLRANLWLQMEQVGEFIQALGQADNARIMQFKAQVDRLAHQLTVATRRTETAAPAPQPARKHDSTITVSALLHDEERRRAQAAANAANNNATSNNATERAAAAGTAFEPANETGNGAEGPARTNAAPVSYTYTASTYTTSDNRDPDSTDDHPIMEAAAGQPGGGTPRPSTAPTIAVSQLGRQTDGTPYDTMAAQTLAIPLLEQEERALRDAQAGLEGIGGTGQVIVTGAVAAAGASSGTIGDAADDMSDDTADNTANRVENRAETSAAEGVPADGTDADDDDDTNETPKA